MIAQFLGSHGQFGHVFEVTVGMRGDEIGDELLVQMLRFVDLVELLFQLDEHVELGLAHQLQHGIAGVFGRPFYPAADMSGDQLTEVFVITHGFALLGGAVVQEEIVADA